MSVIAPGNVAVITGGASGIGLALADVATNVSDTASETASGSPVERMERAESQTNPPMFRAA